MTPICKKPPQITEGHQSNLMASTQDQSRSQLWLPSTEHFKSSVKVCSYEVLMLSWGHALGQLPSFPGAQEGSPSPILGVPPTGHHSWGCPQGIESLHLPLFNWVVRLISTKARGIVALQGSKWGSSWLPHCYSQYLPESNVEKQNVCLCCADSKNLVEGLEPTTMFLASIKSPNDPQREAKGPEPQRAKGQYWNWNV